MPDRTAAAALVGLLLAGTASGTAQGPAAPAGSALERLRAPEARAPRREAPAWVERESLVMGTRLRVRVAAADRARGLRVAERALDAVRRHDDLLSTWRPDTDLARLNRSPVGEAVPLGPPGSPLSGILARAELWSRRTNGAFQPAVGALVDAWDLRGRGRTPDDGARLRALDAVGDGAFHIDPVSRTAVRLHPDAWIDAGGFGKCSALAAAARALEDEGVRRAYLDFGGQVLALGAPGAADAGWTVSVAHPERRREPAAALTLRDASAATTGASERFVTVDGRRLSHVLDPRSGRPAPAWGSVTVVARDPLVADAVSTALFVLGPERALAWARGRPELGVLVLTPSPDGGVRRRWSRGMERWLKDRPPARGSGTETAIHDDTDNGLF